MKLMNYRVSTMLITAMIFANNYAQESPHEIMNLECNACHTPQSWKDIRFDHSQTDFDLEGKHAEVRCIECHQMADFSRVESDCFSCHADVHQGKLGLMCSQCHSPTGWSDLNLIAVHSNTNFPLTGAHLSLDCKACHISEVENEFSFLGGECYNCHQSDFNNSPHQTNSALAFGADCQQCHTTSSWQPASFDHSQTQFPLSGAHLAVECGACHASGFAGAPTDCYSCHQQDYTSANDPNHFAAGFPTTCEDCHSPMAWNQTTWDHDSQYFPIYSGEHRGEWNLCTDCHTNAGNFQVFSCLNCHEHEQQRMDDKHNDVPGYVYESNACLSCHPTGEE